MKITYEEFLQKPVDKSKITSIWSFIGDNPNGDWDHVIHNNQKYISFLLSETSEYFDLDDIDYIFDVGSLNGIESVYFSQYLPNSKIYSFEANPNITPDTRCFIFCGRHFSIGVLSPYPNRLVAIK